MGLDVSVDGAVAFGELLSRLQAAGVPSAVVMVDGALVMPGATPPPSWRNVRLRTPAGTLALKRDGGAVRVVVFGNADAALTAMQARVAELLRP